MWFDGSGRTYSKADKNLCRANIVNSGRGKGMVEQGGRMALKGSDVAVINDSKDDQNRTSTRSC